MAFPGLVDAASSRSAAFRVSPANGVASKTPGVRAHPLERGKRRRSSNTGGYHTPGGLGTKDTPLPPTAPGSKEHLHIGTSARSLAAAGSPFHSKSKATGGPASSPAQEGWRADYTPTHDPLSELKAGVDPWKAAFASTKARSKDKDVRPLMLLAASSHIVRRGSAFSDKEEAMLADDDGDFRFRKWEPPDADVAAQRAEESVYNFGDASVWCESFRAIGDGMGVGISLYLRLQLALAGLFCALLVLSAPLLAAAAQGSQLAAEQVDPLSLARVSLGNVGPARAVETITSVNVTADASGSAESEDMVRPTLMFGFTVDGRDASVVFMGCDLLATLLVFLFVVVFRHLIRHDKMRVDAATITPPDFAVLVRGLPADVTVAEVRQHFSDLYALMDGNDWTFDGWGCGVCRCLRRKTRQRGATVTRSGSRPRPVQDASNTKDAEYVGSWVAEVSLARRHGRAMRQYMKARKLQRKVVRAKARVQMHNSASAKADERLRKRAEETLAKLEEKLQSIVADHVARPDADVVGAFVIFEHATSAERCVADYRDSTSWVGRWLQPTPLRFTRTRTSPSQERSDLEFRLEVTRAPEPTDVIWENVEVTRTESALRRALTAAATALILLLSLALMYVAQQRTAAFAERLPQAQDCTALASIAYGAGTNSSVAVPRGATLVRTRGNDAACGGAENGWFYASWRDSDSAETGPDALVDSFNAVLREQAREASRSDGGRGIYGGACTSHCISAADDTLCRVDAEVGSRTVSRGRAVACYCLDRLEGAILAHGVFEGGALLQEEEADVCLTFASDYAMSQGLILGSALVVVAINGLLKAAMTFLVALERHVSHSVEEAAETHKLLLAQVINLGVITLLVNARLPNNAGDGLPLGILGGQYSDFSAHWFATVGTSLVISLLVQVVAPNVAPLCSACCVRRCVRRRRAKRAVTQGELDEAFAPPEYDIGTRGPFFLSVVLLCLVYGGGLPVGLVAAVTYYLVDRALLFRLMRAPPRYDASVASMATTVLLWGAVGHLAMTAWMFGNDELLPSALVSPGSIVGTTGDPSATADHDVQAAYDAWAEEARSGWDVLGITPRLARWNVLPLAVLLLSYTSYVVVRGTLWRLLKACLVRLGRCLTCGEACVDNRDDLEDTKIGEKATGSAAAAKYIARDADEVSGMHMGYTEEFRAPVFVPKTRLREDVRVSMDGSEHVEMINDELHRVTLSEEEAKLGWRLHKVEPNDDPAGVGFAYKTKHFLSDSADGSETKMGAMATWQVIDELTLASYDIAKNPAYSTLVRNMRHDAEVAGAEERARAAEVRNAEKEASRRLTEISLKDVEAGAPARQDVDSDAKQGAHPARPAAVRAAW